MRLLILSLVMAFGCVPAHLTKYSRSDSRAKSPVRELNGVKSNPSSTDDGSSAPLAATVYAIDSQTFRFALPKEEVWEGILDVLMKNYNLTIVDRDSGIITTEWDSYFLNQVVYRNKISVRLRSNGRKSIDVMIHNNVEKLDQQIGAPTAGVWLPTDDMANETNRLVQNFAIALNQPPPQGMPTSNIATPATENEKLIR